MKTSGVGSIMVSASRCLLMPPGQGRRRRAGLGLAPQPLGEDGQEAGQPGATLDVLVVKCSEANSDGLAASRTLLLNGGWDRYWADGKVLPCLRCS